MATIKTRYTNNTNGAGKVRASIVGRMPASFNGGRAVAVRMTRSVQWDHALSSDANHARAHIALVRRLRNSGFAVNGTWSMREPTSGMRTWSLVVEGATS